MLLAQETSEHTVEAVGWFLENAWLIPLIPGLIDSAFKMVSAIRSAAGDSPEVTAEVKAKLLALEQSLEASKKAVADLVVYKV